jgi:hypothetical protein
LDSFGSVRERLGKAHAFVSLGRPPYYYAVTIGRLVYFKLKWRTGDYFARPHNAPTVQRLSTLRRNFSTYPRYLGIFEAIDTEERALGVFLSRHKRPPVRPVFLHFV